MNSNDIFEPNHINSEARIEEDTGEASDDNESDSSVSYSQSSQSLASSAASSTNSQASIKWVLAEKFTDVDEADKYVKNTSTRDSSKPLCIVILNLSIKNVNHVIKQMYGEQVSIRLINYLQLIEGASMIKSKK